MSIHLYISKKCPFCDTLLRQINGGEVAKHMEIINIDVQKPIPEHKVTHVPTIVFGNNTYVGKGIDAWLEEYKKNSGEEVFPFENEEECADPFGDGIDGGDPFESFGDIKPTVSDEMQKRISMPLGEAYEAMNTQR